MGYDPSILVNQDHGKDFMCTICFEISKEPSQCVNCEKIFCKACIDDWKNVRKQCPFKCNTGEIVTVQISGEKLLNYNRLEIHCSKKCGKSIRLDNIEEHLAICGLSPCLNYNLCQNKSKFNIEGIKVCSQSCFDFHNLKRNNNRNKKDVYKFIKYFKLLKKKMNINLLKKENNFKYKGYKLEK